MKTYLNLKSLGILGVLLTPGISYGGTPFFLGTLSPAQLENPQSLCANFTTSLGEEICQTTNYTHQTELVRQLSADSVGEGEEEAKAHFDLGCIYFFGMGVEKHNQTAVFHFLSSNRLSEWLAIGGSNAMWIKHGPAKKY